MPTHKTQVPKWFDNSVTKLANIGMVVIPVGVVAFLASPDVQKLAPPEVRHYLAQAGIPIHKAAERSGHLGENKAKKGSKKHKYIGGTLTGLLASIATGYGMQQVYKYEGARRRGA